MFAPTLKKTVANIHCGMPVGNLYRFQAVVSSLERSDWKDAIQAQLGDNARLSEVIIPVKEVAGGKLVEGFAVKRTETHYVQANELSSTLEKLGCKEVARNMYMDEDEKVWSVKIVDDRAIITKSGTDEIEELLASANKLHNYKGDVFKPTIDVANFEPCKVAFVNEAGEVDYGIAFATVANSNRVQILRTEEISATPTIVDTFAVFATEELPDMQEDEDFEGVDNMLEYYRKVYSDDPAMMDSLEELVEDVVLV